MKQKWCEVSSAVFACLWVAAFVGALTAAAVVGAGLWGPLKCGLKKSVEPAAEKVIVPSMTTTELRTAFAEQLASLDEDERKDQMLQFLEEMADWVDNTGEESLWGKMVELVEDHE